MEKQVSKKSNPKTKKDPEKPKMTLIDSFGIGFGNLKATADNIPPGSEEPKLPEAAEIFVRAASSCCDSIGRRCCCMCCIQCCSRMNDQCAIVLTQFCGALACFGCFSCCQLCCGGGDG